jgi:hypothetical protein
MWRACWQVLSVVRVESRSLSRCWCMMFDVGSDSCVLIEVYYAGVQVESSSDLASDLWSYKDSKER